MSAFVTFVLYLLLGLILLLLPYRLFTSYISVFVLAVIVSYVLVHY